MGAADPAEGLTGRVGLADLDRFSCETAGIVLGPAGILETRGDLDRERPLRSVTKSLTGYAVAVAVDRGLVDLDEAAGPEGATLRHLLAHASGYFYESDGVLMAPGRRRHYSNFGIDEAARVVERRVGTEFGQWVVAEVAAPLGMRDLRWNGSASVGGFAPLGDLARFVTELMQPTLVGPETFTAFTTPQFPELVGIMPGFGKQDPNPFGLGFEVRGGKSPHWTGRTNDPSTFGHFGMLGTMFWVDPVAELALVVGTDLTFCDEHREVLPVVSDAVVRAYGRSRG